MKYENHLIEQIDLKVSFVNPVPVTIDFSQAIPVIGFATLRKEDNGIYADFQVEQDVAGLYPCIGYRTSPQYPQGMIYEVSLCYNPNEDEEIKPL